TLAYLASVETGGDSMPVGTVPMRTSRQVSPAQGKVMGTCDLVTGVCREVTHAREVPMTAWPAVIPAGSVPVPARPAREPCRSAAALFVGLAVLSSLTARAQAQGCVGYWLPEPNGPNGTVTSLTAWDPDGPGPLESVIVAGGIFSNAGGTPAYRAAARG